MGVYSTVIGNGLGMFDRHPAKLINKKRNKKAISLLISVISAPMLLFNLNLAYALTISSATDQPVLWPNGDIQYYVVEKRTWFSFLFRNISSREMKREMKKAVAAGMEAWNDVGEEVGAFQFVEVTPETVDRSKAFLVVELRGASRISACGASTSQPGYPGQGNSTVLVLPENCPKSVTHELGHVLGFLHEHSREDANLALNLCHHKRAGSGESCLSIWTLLWSMQTGKRSDIRYLNEYDPFSLMHYDLQNNIKPELADQMDPETGFSYTTIDFSRDPEKANNIVALASRLGVTEQDLYVKMAEIHSEPVELISVNDRDAVKALYASGLVDTQISLVVNCIATRVAPDQCGGSQLFNVTMEAKNYGAWPAHDVDIFLPLPNNIDLSMIDWEVDNSVICDIDQSQRIFHCSLGALPAQSISKIDLISKFMDLNSIIELQARITTTSSQNPFLKNEGQDQSDLLILNGQ